MNFIIVSLLCYLVFSMAFVVFAFERGVKIGRGAREEKRKGKDGILKREYKMTKEEKEELRKINTALNNIENYDGSSRRQRKIRA